MWFLALTSGDLVPVGLVVGAALEEVSHGLRGGIPVVWIDLEAADALLYDLRGPAPGIKTTDISLEGGKF